MFINVALGFGLEHTNQGRGMLTRRHFAASATAFAFAGLALRHNRARAGAPTPRAEGYGLLRPDPAALLDLPEGFSYRVLSQLGDRMDDGCVVPDRADGMGALRLDQRRVALVRNHELPANRLKDGPAGADGPGANRAYARNGEGQALPGGTSTLIVDMTTGKLEAQYLSLAGTIRNCAGGVTPWGSWLSCEEDVTKASGANGRDHGYVFEVPAHMRGLADPVPIKAMGRFNHEAVAIDPRTGIAYLTEDRDNGLFYRFLPDQRGRLHAGGRLQALAFTDRVNDSRNWDGAMVSPGAWKGVRWIDLDGVEAPDDDLRARGHRGGAALFARGEGIHWGRGEFYFCCTSGGAARLGQVFRYVPSPHEGQPGEKDQPGHVQLFVESTDGAALNYGDNLTVAPNGHLIVCEDQYSDPVDNYLRGVTPSGAVYPIARLRTQTETAGACFSPDGRTMFLNVYSPAKTLAITGPWARVSEAAAQPA